MILLSCAWTCAGVICAEQPPVALPPPNASPPSGSHAPPAVPNPLAAAPFTPNQRARLAQRDRLALQAKTLEDAGKLAEAIAAADQVLTIDREIFDPNHPEVIGWLSRLAALHQARGDFAAARQLDEQELAASIERVGKDHWSSVLAQCELDLAQLLEKLDATPRQQFLKSIALARTAERFAENASILKRSTRPSNPPK